MMELKIDAHPRIKQFRSVITRITLHGVDGNPLYSRDLESTESGDPTATPERLLFEIAAGVEITSIRFWQGDKILATTDLPPRAIGPDRIPDWVELGEGLDVEISPGLTEGEG